MRHRGGPGSHFSLGVCELRLLPSDVRGPDRDYVVIGGGFAGLHCARRLADAGFQVTVLERTGRLMAGASRARTWGGSTWAGTI
ncbi:FAD-dependent oxidoreductase [Streptomyces sp. NPDC098789]|uniref:FAD-dependent oxidoreductase n=1 Tax=Streptomyces sp. NPDC098789 TaxID=3366098 RepID=UPI00380A5178